MKWNIVRSEFNQWTNKTTNKVVDSYEDAGNAVEIAAIYQADVPYYKRITYNVQSA